MFLKGMELERDQAKYKKGIWNLAMAMKVLAKCETRRVSCEEFQLLLNVPASLAPALALL